MASGSRADMAQILLAEDDESLRKFLAAALVRAGHDVADFGDGAEAWEAMQGVAFDLLLTDIVMPGMDGIALAAQATRDNPQMSVLMMTGFASEGQRAQASHNAVERVISKPFSLKDICSAVEEALQKRRARMH